MPFKNTESEHDVWAPLLAPRCALSAIDEKRFLMRFSISSKKIEFFFGLGLFRSPVISFHNVSMRGGAAQNYTKDTGWYYSSPTDRAAAWSGVEALYSFLIRQHRVGPKGREISLAEVKPGDVIQLSFTVPDFGHSLLVVQTGSIPTISNTLIATHSDDSDYRPLISYNFSDMRCLKISA